MWTAEYYPWSVNGDPSKSGFNTPQEAWAWILGEGCHRNCKGDEFPDCCNCALTAEWGVILTSQYEKEVAESEAEMRAAGIEPARIASTDFKSVASAVPPRSPQRRSTRSCLPASEEVHGPNLVQP